MALEIVAYDVTVDNRTRRFNSALFTLLYCLWKQHIEGKYPNAKEILLWSSDQTGERE
jgi:hypothetical protein